MPLQDSPARLQPHPTTARVRASKLASADAMGIDPALIDRLVEQFYARVRRDPLLGPIFAARIVDWPPHLARMKAFWSVILRGEGAFNGNPMKLHAAIPEIEREHFERWLALFDATLHECSPVQTAIDLISSRAHAIADSLLTGVRIHRDGCRDIQAMKGMHDA